MTSFQMSEVVIEQGVAEVFGRDQREQARQLIEHAAHPRAREDLREEASALGLAEAGPSTLPTSDRPS